MTVVDPSTLALDRSAYSVDTNGQLEPALSQEWVLTNGTGAFAGSSLVGANTRRYHGLLCAATNPPLGRVITLSRVGEILKIDGRDTLLELSVNVFAGGSIHPRGDRFLRRVTIGDTVRFDYDVDGVRVAKEVQLFWKRNVAAIRYTIEPNGHQVELSLLPFFAMRDFHALRRKTGDAQPFDVRSDGHVSIRDVHSNLTAHVRADRGTFRLEPDWWTGHVLPIETDRGQDDVEDLFKPGMFVFSTREPASVTLWTSIEDVPAIDWDAELERRRAHMRRVTRANTSVAIHRLERAANDFVVDRKSPDGSPGVTVIAGYPWFGDWGRDTMIALPGLLLATGRHDEAARVLGVFASYVSDGMIPNRFDDYTNKPDYNTVDASLWFIHAAYEYRRITRNEETFARTLLPACREIIRGYKGGTRYHIKMDERDGLVAQGDEHTQLTWMDAKCNGVAFTPRQGKPVEINALWYHALVLMGDEYGDLAARVKESFSKAFWISPFRGLADVAGLDGNRDMAIRPNQIFAASVPNSPLNEDQRRAVVEVVRRELLTPYGLRTLNRADPKYRAVYRGTQFERDRTYHNGMVWPWLIGAFLEAYLRVNARSPESIEQVRQWLAPLMEHLERQACIGSISEIFEAEAPYRPVGCYAQAWSVAEVLRIASDVGL
jgi:predicted glycogen debranching enzyme